MEVQSYSCSMFPLGFCFSAELGHSHTQTKYIELSDSSHGVCGKRQNITSFKEHIQIFSSSSWRIQWICVLYMVIEKVSHPWKSVTVRCFRATCVPPEEAAASIAGRHRSNEVYKHDKASCLPLKVMGTALPQRVIPGHRQKTDYQRNHLRQIWKVRAARKETVVTPSSRWGSIHSQPEVQKNRKLWVLIHPAAATKPQ